MTSDLTVTVHERINSFLYDSAPWQDLIEETLRGSLNKTTQGDTTIYLDRYSGLKMTVEKTGGAISGLTIEAPESGRGSPRTALVEASFGGDAVDADAFLKALDATFRTSGASPALDGFLMDFTYDVTTIGQSTPVPLQPGSVVIGGNRDDDFRLSDGYHQVYATRGNDSYVGGSHHDNVTYEMIRGGGIKLVRDGGNRIVEKPGGDVDKLSGFEGITGTNGNDNLSVGLGNVSSQVHGMDGNDRIGGGSKRDLLEGNAGNDKIVGRGGGDVLIGGDGDDNLNGGSGDDVLFGGNGYGYGYAAETNVMKGGKGSDLFVLESNGPYAAGPSIAMIRDFKPGKDFLGLVGTNSRIYGSDDNLVFGDLEFADSAGGAVISANGVEVAVLRNVQAADLSRADFVELVSGDEGYLLFDDFFGGLGY